MTYARPWHVHAHVHVLVHDKCMLRQVDVRMSRWWLHFTSDHDLERRFRAMYSRQTVRRMRFPTLVAGVGLLSYTCWKAVSYSLGGSGMDTAKVSPTRPIPIGWTRWTGCAPLHPCPPSARIMPDRPPARRPARVAATDMRRDGERRRPLSHGRPSRSARFSPDRKSVV